MCGLPSLSWRQRGASLKISACVVMCFNFLCVELFALRFWCDAFDRLQVRIFLAVCLLFSLFFLYEISRVAYQKYYFVSLGHCPLWSNFRSNTHHSFRLTLICHAHSLSQIIISRNQWNYTMVSIIKYKNNKEISHFD